MLLQEGRGLQLRRADKNAILQVAATTITSTTTATATTTVLSAGTFFIIDANTEESGFAVEDTEVFKSSLLSTFNFTNGGLTGALTVVSTNADLGDAAAAAGDGIYTDPNALFSGAQADSLYGLQPSDAATQGATAISCSVVQNADGTCPLTCTGNGGSQFYGCDDDFASDIQIGPAGPPGVCDMNSAYNPIDPYIVTV